MEIGLDSGALRNHPWRGFITVQFTMKMLSPQFGNEEMSVIHIRDTSFTKVLKMVSNCKCTNESFSFKCSLK